MATLVLILHIIVCSGLIVIVLVQRGRGGGLVEGFSGVESMFGTRTSAFLTKATTVLSVLFFATCIGLAGLSARRSKSLMRGSAIEPGAAVEKSVDAAEETAGKAAETEGASAVSEESPVSSPE